jgi:hypothetical protein
MRAKGFILQYSNGDRRGMIHFGERPRHTLLPFALSDCDKTLQKTLCSDNIPPSSAVSVSVDIAVKQRGLWATDIRLNPQKSAAVPERAGKSAARVRRKSSAKGKR